VPSRPVARRVRRCSCRSWGEQRRHRSRRRRGCSRRRRAFPHRAPAQGATVVLVPAAEKRDQTQLFKTATTDQNGGFSFKAIAPGSYKLFAWENLEQYGYFDLNIVQQADTQATPVRVTESSTQSIEVRSIP